MYEIGSKQVRTVRLCASSGEIGVTAVAMPVGFVLQSVSLQLAAGAAQTKAQTHQRSRVGAAKFSASH
jgi:hypothetical protein